MTDVDVRGIALPPMPKEGTDDRDLAGNAHQGGSSGSGNTSWWTTMGDSFEPMEYDKETDAAGKRGEKRTGDDIQELPGQSSEPMQEEYGMALGEIGYFRDARGEQSDCIMIIENMETVDLLTITEGVFVNNKAEKYSTA